MAEPKYSNIVQVFKDAWEGADAAGLAGSRTETALQKVFETVGWEIHDMGLPPDAYDHRTAIVRHVLYRVELQ